MAESTESQSIKKLTKIIQEENADRKKELEKTANQEVASQKTLKALEKISKGNGEAAKKASEKLEREMAKNQEAAAAENQIKNDDDSLREQKKLTGLSAKRTDWRMVNSNLHSYTICQKWNSKYRNSNPDIFYKIDRPRKHRYIYYLGDKKNKKQFLKNLKYPIMDYPK